MKPKVILVIDDDKVFPKHPRSADLFYAKTASQALELLKDKDTVDIEEIWLDFVLLQSDIVPVLQELIRLGKEEPDFSHNVTVRFITTNFSSAEFMKERLEPFYKTGEHPGLQYVEVQKTR